MSYTDPGKRLSSPTKCGRIWYVDEPFLAGFSPVGGGSVYKKENMDWYFKEAKQFSENTHVVSPLKSYRQHHQYLVEELPKLKGLNFIFIPGTSPDLNEVRPDMVGHDIFSERFRLSKNILEVFNKLDIYFDENQHPNRKLLENYCILAVAPFVLSIGKIERDDSKDMGYQLYLKHPIGHIFNRVNDWLAENDKGLIKLEDILLEKRLDQDIIGQKGMTEFSDFLYDLNAAKPIFINYEKWPKAKIDEAEKHIAHSIYLNKQMLGVQWGKIFDLLGIEKPALFIKKSSPFYEAIEKFSNHEIDLVSGEKGFLRNMPISPLSECHPSALEFLEGRIKRQVRRGNR